MPYLSAADLNRAVRAQRVLMSPGDFASERTYRLACNRALRELLGADQVIAFSVGEQIDLLSEETPKSVLHQLTENYQALRSGEATDPYIAAFVRSRLQALGGPFGDWAERDLLERSVTYQELLRSAGLSYLMGPSLASAKGEVSALCAFADADAPYYGEIGEVLLKLVQPAFEVGMSAPRVVPEAPEIDVPLILYSLKGRERRRSSAFERLAAQDPDISKVLSAAQALARRASSGLESVRTSLTTKTAHYQLSATFYSSSSERHVFVTVRCRSLKPAPASAKHYRLTKRQTEVALLLAQGLTDKQVAARLDISHNTARRHAEQVLKKLDVPNRAAVALRLLA